MKLTIRVQTFSNVFDLKGYNIVLLFTVQSIRLWWSSALCVVIFPEDPIRKDDVDGDPYRQAEATNSAQLSVSEVS